ncbi:hypothetical protein [Mycoplasma sp. HF14]
MNNKDLTPKAIEINKKFSDLKRSRKQLKKIKWIIAGTLSITAIFVVLWILVLIPSTFSAKLKVYQYEHFPTFQYAVYDDVTPLFVYNKHYLFYAGTLGAVAFYSIALVLVCCPFYLFAYFYLYRIVYFRQLKIVKNAQEKYTQTVNH